MYYIRGYKGVLRGNMQKIINLLLVLCITIAGANANPIDRVISKSNVNKSAVSVSVKDIDTGKILYEHNGKKPMIPASTLKAVTYISALNELGTDYEFTTSLYKNTNNELFLRLGADPFLQGKDLKVLIEAAKSKNIYEPKAFKIDDTIIDQNEWGEGWQWDDDLNPLMPKFSAYNIDQNLLHLNVFPEAPGAPADLRLTEFYPVTFTNLITTGKVNNIKLSRNNSISPNILKLEGSVSSKTEVVFPVNYPRRYFILRLEEAIRSRKLGYYGNFAPEKLPSKNVYLIGEIKNPIASATSEVMINSNNMVAETVFKLAGGHYSKTTGSADQAIEMLKKHCQDINVNTEDIRVVDGSGVSKNNLVTADFMTDFLIKENQYNKDYITIFAKPGEGTFKKRMLYLQDKLNAKSGTLADVSALTGFVKTLKGKTLAFDIMINDAKSSASDKKMLEEYILRTIYSEY